jgi:predicted DNA-binding transcriptional regulator YafY
MRADRLLSLLMLLQSRGRLPARRLAEELEVSERTIYRDIEALGMAGVPVYAERGPGGGCALLESYRSNLTGLTAAEVQALFMLSIPAPLAQLGVSQELKAALLKLSAAVPLAHRQEEERSRQRIYLDSTWWFQAEETVPCLPDIQQALWQDRRVKITYQLQFGAEVERVVSPFGLVAKTNVWYLVGEWNGAVGVFRVAAITRAQALDEAASRPPDFNLAAFWKDWAEGYEGRRGKFLVTARLAPELARDLPRYFGDNFLSALAAAGPPDESGWVTLTLPFENIYTARDRILGLGAAIEVLEPPALRLSVIDFAGQIINFYAAGSRKTAAPDAQVPAETH